MTEVDFVTVDQRRGSADQTKSRTSAVEGLVDDDRQFKLDATRCARGQRKQVKASVMWSEQ